MAKKRKKRTTRVVNNIKFPKKEDLVKIPFLNLVYLAVVLNVSTALFTIVFQGRIPPEVPLYYGLAEGSNQLGKSIELTLPSAVSLSILIVNIAITLFIKNEFLKQVLILSGFLVALFSTITVFKIAFLVGSF